ncbi:MAG: 3-hydroxyacyl-CoA dehydrogenase/enoyl-CoA hydratase family protein [Deltaproteobacteria bacterium]|nr:3-hydroxyacyl-CoA dehydrogenase/enoyl-CoA hydratase family protein [Deltaproteobacteria bacterium]
MLIRKAAVLGAGAMGSGIAAHLANAGISTLLLDVVPGELTVEEAKRGLSLEEPPVRNRFALKGVEAAKKGGLAAFGHPDRAGLVTPGNFEDDLGKLADVDWVVEAVVERLDVKVGLLGRVAVHLKSGALLTTNTSGLSVNAMADALPGELRPRFFGTHFFNPPRYMYLLELIPGLSTSAEVLAGFREFAEVRLGKGVVVGKDTPNFVANRIGIYSTAYAIGVMEKHGFGIEEVDAVTGGALGRASTATFGTSDLAGVDVLPHVVRTQYEGAPEDECREHLVLPPWIGGMIERGYFGRKVGAGFYKEQGTLAIDPATLEYHPKRKIEFESVAAASRIADPGARIAALVYADDPAGRFAWDLTASTLLYAANRVPEIADDLPSVDRAMRWGYAWELGPFELWDAIGVRESVERMVGEGRKVPGWVKALAASDCPTFYKNEDRAAGAWDVGKASHVPVAKDPRVMRLAELKRAGRTLRENDQASLIDLGEGVACIEFRTKANVVDEGVLALVEDAVANAGSAYRALVLGNQGAFFSAGANLAAMADKIVRQDWEAIDRTIRTAQRAMMALKRSPIPVVAAPFGKVLGGGLEVCLHCHRVQASHETNMGLVELGVGLLPAAGGTKELLLRRTARAEGFPLGAAQRAFEVISQAKVSGSAWEAFDLGYLREGDGVTMNREHLIYAAKRTALGMLESGWQPVPPATVAVLGRDGLANLRAQIHNMRDAGYLSDHDALLADRVAWVLCGGDVDAGALVGEQYLLDLERKAFVELCRTPKTLERIQHMLKTGKPLRN